MTAKELDGIRKSKDISLRDLGKQVGVSAGFLCDAFWGRRTVSEKVAERVAKALDLPAKDVAEAISLHRCPHCGKYYNVADAPAKVEGAFTDYVKGTAALGVTVKNNC